MDKDKVKAFANRIFDDMAGAMTTGLAYLGVRTGLFRAMSGQGPMTVSEIVAQTGFDSRYVEEWLKGLVCAGYLEYTPETESYELPGEHGFLLASDDTDHFAGGLFAMVPPLLRVAPQVAECFREGGGVPFEEYGDDGVTALDLINRGNYRHKLVDYWIPAMPDAMEKLERGAEVLDVGCGTGEVVTALARAFPRSSFLGVDLDAKSIERARQTARENDLEDRVEFSTTPVEELQDTSTFDFVTACDCIHDLTDPVGTLKAVRRLVARDGTLFVVEPKAADRLEDNRHSVGTMFYGFSVFHCMTQSLAEGGPGLGTCLGPARTEALMREAGFRHCEQLDIKSRVNLFYRAG